MIESIVISTDSKEQNLETLLHLGRKLTGSDEQDHIVSAVKVLSQYIGRSGTSLLLALWWRQLAYCRLEHYDHALADLNELIALDAMTPSHFLDRAYVYLRLNETEALLDDLNHYLMLGGDPNEIEDLLADIVT